MWGNPFNRSAVDLDIKAHLIRFPSWGHRIDTAWKWLFRPEAYLGEHSIVSKVAYHRVLRHLAPDIVLMNYANSMFLLPRRARATVIVDMHDFLSLSRHLSVRARALLAEERYEFSPPAFIVEDFMRDSADEVSREAAALGRSDLILAISKDEARIFQDRAQRPVYVLNYHAAAPATISPARRSQLGIMPVGTGENPYNILGAHCIDRVMDYSGRTVIAAVGRVAREMRLGSWCEPVGHVANYFDVIRSYGFGVCPAFWGTGAQIKQYEFAELGMPIVAYRWMVDAELWIDGENCLLADDPRAFAERLCSMALSSKRLVDLREGAKLLKQRVAARLARQQAELDCRLGLRATDFPNANHSVIPSAC